MKQCVDWKWMATPLVSGSTGFGRLMSMGKLPHSDSVVPTLLDSMATAGPTGYTKAPISGASWGGQILPFRLGLLRIIRTNVFTIYSRRASIPTNGGEGMTRPRCLPRFLGRAGMKRQMGEHHE